KVSSDADRIDTDYQRELLFVDQPWENHNGGNLVFGPDGKLYVGLGDGGSANDPKRNGQNKGVLLGKMLRLDVDVDKPKPEIVVVGLRNPWRYSFDAKTGDLYIGDVGQSTWEEVDVLPAGKIDGANLGWNVTEGDHCFQGKKCDLTKYTEP